MCTLRLAAAAILIFSAALAQPAPEPLTYYIDETCENLHPDARFKAKEENPRASIEEAFNIAKGLDARFRNTPEQEPDAYRALQTVFGIEGEIVNSEEHNAVKMPRKLRTKRVADVRFHCSDGHLIFRPDPPNQKPWEKRNFEIEEVNRVIIDRSNGIVSRHWNFFRPCDNADAMTYSSSTYGVELRYDEEDDEIPEPFPELFPNYGKWSQHKHDRSVIVICKERLKDRVPRVKYVEDINDPDWLLDADMLRARPDRAIDRMLSVQSLVVFHELQHIIEFDCLDVTLPNEDDTSAYGFDNALRHKRAFAIRNADNYAVLAAFIRVEDDGLKLSISAMEPLTGRIVRKGSGKRSVLRGTEFLRWGSARS